MDKKPYYDNISYAYSYARQAYIANRRYNDYFSTHILNCVPNLSNQSIVLDCMAGSCEFARMAKPAVQAIHAVDLSLGILRRADPDTLPTSRTCGDALKLPFAKNSFDAVFVRGGLHHIHDHYMDALEEIFRVLKPGGWLVCAEAADDNPIIWLARSTLHIVSKLFEPGEKGFRAKELSTALKDLGFTSVKLEPFGYLGYTLIGNTDVFPLLSNLRSSTVINALIYADRLSVSVPLWRYFALAHIAIGQKPLIGEVIANGAK